MEGNRLRIDDIEVDEDHPLPWPVFHGLLLRLGVKCRTVSLRGKCIGSRMLNRLLFEARRSGAEIAWGFVNREDAGKSPFLLDWYRRHGFTVAEPDSECPADSLKKISRQLA